MIGVECDCFLLLPVVWMRKTSCYMSVRSGMYVFCVENLSWRDHCLATDTYFVPNLLAPNCVRTCNSVVSVPDERMYRAITFLSPCCNLQ